MPDELPSRRGRPTLRCFTQDSGLELPLLDVDLGDVDDLWLAELRRIAPHFSDGSKSASCRIGSPMVYRLRVSDERGRYVA